MTDALSSPKTPAAFKADTVVINARYMKDRINELGMRVWWVAEQIKVDRGTVSRWLNGKVKWVKICNLQALAELLEVNKESLILTSETDRLATADDLRKAAELIHNKNMKQLIRTSENWQLLEYTIKSSLSPTLPLNLLGSLYIDIAQACLFQNKITQSRDYIAKAIEIAERLENTALLMRGRVVKATVETCCGSLDNAIALYHQCLKNTEDLNDRWTGEANLALALIYQGDFEGAAALNRKTRDYFHQLPEYSEDPVSWSKFHITSGQIELYLENYDNAKQLFDGAAQIAGKGAYQKGIHYAKLMRALGDSYISPMPEQAQAYQQAHEGLRTIQDDQLFYFYGSTVYKHLRRFDETEALLKKAIHMSKDFPCELGIFYAALCELGLTTGDRKKASDAYRKACKHLEVACAHHRLADIKKAYHSGSL